LAVTALKVADWDTGAGKGGRRLDAGERPLGFHRDTAMNYPTAPLQEERQISSVQRAAEAALAPVR
jgi:hypothetical protein